MLDDALAFLAARRFAEAEAALKSILSDDPGVVVAWRALGTVYERTGHLGPAVACFSQAVVVDPSHVPTLCSLAGLKVLEGDPATAIAVYTEALRLAPDDPVAGFALACLTGTSTDRVPHAFVQTLFDNYAERYDAHMNDVLGYDGPTLVAAALPGSLGRVADLGCGTGLSGIPLRDRAGELVGIDLSGGMLTLAAERGIYDVLAVAPLLDFLGDCAPFDTVVAVDVLPYIGALDALWPAVRNVVAPAGRFAFTLEAGAETLLQSSGRFVHAVDEVLALSERTGFTVASAERHPIRSEDGNPVLADVVVLLA